MIRTIRLYGELGKKFGKVHKYDVATVGEALRALCANYKEFKQCLVDLKVKGYEVWDGKYNVNEKQEDFVKVGNGDIKIIPRITGSSNGARIIGGAVLIIIGVIANIYAPGNPISPMLYKMGASMILGGVVGMMSENASGTTTDSDGTNTESYIFSGAVNTTKQGNPVPIGYGKMLVGSQVISASISTTDIAIA